MIITNQNQVLWEENNYTEQQMNYNNKSESEINATTSDTKTSSTPIDWKSITDPKLRKKAEAKAYYEANKDKKKAYYQENKSKIKAYNEANKEKQKAYREANRDKANARQKAYCEANKDKIKAYYQESKDELKAYYQENKVEIRAKHKEYRDSNKPLIKIRKEVYRKANLDKINAYHNHRYETDIQYRLSKLLRTRLWCALKGGWKSGSAVKDLGCTIPELQTYLESKFQSGMTWDNQGEWHIDHIKPLASFDLTNREQLLIACHYSNLQPLWATENIVKSDIWTD